MTDFENEVLAMMSFREQDLLLRVLALSSCREGAIVSLVAGRLQDMMNSGLMDRLYPELVDAVEAETVVVKSKPVEPVVTPEVVTTTTSMEVGDIVIANWNIANTPGLNGDVVKILVFEGDQVCVKHPGGTISVFNVKNLRPIPKDF